MVIILCIILYRISLHHMQYFIKPWPLGGIPNKNLMDILSRSGRIPNNGDELIFLQQQKKQYITSVKMR